MFWSARLFWPFFLLVVGVICLFQGTVVLKTGCAELPWGRGARIDGPRARAWGWFLLLLGGWMIYLLPSTLG